MFVFVLLLLESSHLTGSKNYTHLFNPKSFPNRASSRLFAFVPQRTRLADRRTSQGFFPIEIALIRIFAIRRRCRERNIVNFS